jgi:zinc protease
MTRFHFSTRLLTFTLMLTWGLSPVGPAFSAPDKTATSSKSEMPDRVFNAETFTLGNGLQVVVIPNSRAPVVTHMLWIRAGAADEPESVGGAAHFIEHLMFKGTPRQAPGEYSRRIRELGGQDNAFTGQDFTAYFFTITSEHLATIMAMERERFMHLQPPDSDIASEKQVIIEERRQRTENDPLGPLTEQMRAYLFASHPYDKPVIGWMDDMKRLTWQDAQAFMTAWYAPNNMMLVVSGDVTTSQIRQLAQKYYGDWKKRDVPGRDRLSPPLHPGQMTLQFKSDKVKQPQLMMAWLAPSFRQNPERSRILEVLVETLDGGASTRLYQDLVVKKKRATAIGLTYDGDTRDDGSFWVSATPAAGVTLTDLKTDILHFLDETAKNLTDTEVAEAIKRLQRQAIYARDSVAGPAMTIGNGLAAGASLEDIETWPQKIATVTVSDIKGIITDMLRCTPGESCQPPLTALIEVDSAAVQGDNARALPQSSLTGAHR